MLLNMSLIVTQLSRSRSRSRWVTVTGQNRKYHCKFESEFESFPDTIYELTVLCLAPKFVKQVIHNDHEYNYFP